MKKELANIFGNVFLKVKLEKENKWVHNNWIGYLTQDNVKTGALAYIEVVKEAGYSCVLNDNSNVLGSWEHSIEWVRNEWEPLAAKAGIKYFAFIVSQNSMTEETVKAFENVIKAFEVRVFYAREEAEAWLKRRLIGLR
jgi:hypothetical protein